MQQTTVPAIAKLDMPAQPGNIQSIQFNGLFYWYPLQIPVHRNYMEKDIDILLLFAMRNYSRHPDKKMLLHRLQIAIKTQGFIFLYVQGSCFVFVFNYTIVAGK